MPTVHEFPTETLGLWKTRPATDQNEKIITIPTGLNTCRIPGDFRRMCIRIEFEFISHEYFSLMCIRICYEIKFLRYVYLIQVDGAQSFFTYVYVC